MSSVYYAGHKLTIKITADGAWSLKDLAAAHEPKLNCDLARANALIKTFADNRSLRSPDQFRQEGKGFWAIRAGRVRLYGWYEPGGIFVISHAICKLHDKLATADINRMNKNQTEYRNE